MAEPAAVAARFDRGADWLVTIASFLALAVCVAAYWPLPGLEVFGHDEVHYYSDFRFKLVEDGRWLNFLLHDGLRSVPPGAWAGLVLACSWTTFFLIGRLLGTGRALAALFASTTLTAYPLAEQFLWPATSAPAVLVCLLLCLLAHRRVAPGLVYGSGGVLLFGTLQGFYFVLPLLFLGPWVIDEAPRSARWRRFVCHFGAWVAGAVLGAVVMVAMVWWLSGSAGPQPAAWRHATPIDSLAGLWRNLDFVAAALVRHVTRLLSAAGMGTPWFAVALAGMLLLRARYISRGAPAFVYLLAVALAFFAFCVPLAPAINARSLVALVAALGALVVLAPGDGPRGRVVAALLLLGMCLGFGQRSAAQLRQHRDETNAFLVAVRDLLPRPASSYSRIVFLGSAAGTDRVAWRLNRPPLMHAIFHAAGARYYLDCRQGALPGCETRPPTTALASRPFAAGELQLRVEPGEVAVVTYRE